MEVIRCDTCGREWRIRADRPVPRRIEAHYRIHGGGWDWWESARFTVRPA